MIRDYVRIRELKRIFHDIEKSVKSQQTQYFQESKMLDGQQRRQSRASLYEQKAVVPDQAQLDYHLRDCKALQAIVVLEKINEPDAKVEDLNAVKHAILQFAEVIEPYLPASSSLLSIASPQILPTVLDTVIASIQEFKDKTVDS